MIWLPLSCLGIGAVLMIMLFRGEHRKDVERRKKRRGGSK